MPIENKKEIDLELSSALKQAFQEAKEAGFGGSYDDFVSSMSKEALRSLLSKGGRVRLKEGGEPFDPVAEWLRLIQIRARLSEAERRTVDDLVNRMFNPDKDKDE